MYKQAPIDLNMMDQAWFDGLVFPYNFFLMWLLFQMKNSLGIVEVNIHKFAKMTDGLLKPEDVDVFAFAEAMNKDKPDRVIFLDRGKSIWFTPTVIFRHCDTKTGIRKFSTSDRDITHFRELSAREETRDWFEEQILYNDRLEFNPDVLVRAYNHKEAGKATREYCRRLARKMGVQIKAGKNHPDDIKDRYGCTCQYCGNVYARTELEIDHVIRQSSDLRDVEAWQNLVPACESCNHEKGDMHPMEFVKLKGYDLQIGVEKALKFWEKKGVLKLKKERTYTYIQVRDWVSSHPGTSMDDYEVVEVNGEKRWKLRWARGSPMIGG